MHKEDDSNGTLFSLMLESDQDVSADNKEFDSNSGGSLYVNPLYHMRSRPILKYPYLWIFPK